MRRLLTTILLSAAVAGCAFHAQSVLAQTPAPATPATQPNTQVPVRQVTLFSSGVGYFEHDGNVTGDASAEFLFKTQQINDVLKSLVLQDAGGGKVSVVTYPSHDPLAKTLRSFEVDLSANPSLGDLLNQLRGANVKCSLTQGEQIEGSILGLEKKHGGEKGNIEYWVLNLISGANIRSIQLDDLQNLQLLDPHLQKELQQALLAVAQARDQDKKPVTIQFLGQGPRQVCVGYVVETPIWKTSYRLLLHQEAGPEKQGVAQPPAGTQHAVLQGWAIIENQTDNDWNNVQLSLVSGRPISFIQDLYQPLYLPRPVVEPELFASLRPQTYEGGISGEKETEKITMGEAPRASAEKEKTREDQQGAAGGQAAHAEQRTLQSASLNAASSIALSASAAQWGELFEFTVGAVSLPRQRSAMIPILNHTVDVLPLSIYNQNVQPRFPLCGVRLTNVTGVQLLQGPVTVFDAQAAGAHYLGDATIDNVPPAQQRLLSYGIDFDLLVNADKTATADTVVSGKLVKGVLIVSVRSLYTQEYSVQNKSNQDKTLLIEQPVLEHYKLVEGPDQPKSVETTSTVYRFEEKIPAKKDMPPLKVQQEFIDAQEYALLNMGLGDLEVYIKCGQISPKVRDALAKVVLQRNQVADSQRHIAEKIGKVSSIRSEQSSLRENMKVVSPSGDYYKRLEQKLNEQETQVDQLQHEISDLQIQRDAQREALDKYLGDLNVE